MSKFYGFDQNKTASIAKITTAKIALMSGLVVNEDRYITGSENEIIISGNNLITVGDSIFKTNQTTLTASDLDEGSSFQIGKDYYIYICDPTDGDDTDYSSEEYIISLSSTYPDGYNSDTSRKIGGFHYGVVRKVNSVGDPINSSNVVLGTDWESNVFTGILPNSIWTLTFRPMCDPTGMAYIGNGIWGDIYLSSDNGNNGVESVYDAYPITGTEGMSWYTFNEKARRVGKRLASYAEFCQAAYGSPEGKDANNTYAWSKTDNSARQKTGYVQYAVSATNIRDLVGNVWKWLNEFCLDPTASSWGWQDVLGSGYGDAYIPSNTALHAFLGGGCWGNGVRGGSRAVSCDNCPWFGGYAGVGGWCVCDSL